MSQAVIPDHIQEGLKVLFVGYNPSLMSSKTGHHYANPNNRFWRVLYAAGITPRLFRTDENEEMLQLGYGFTNIVARPTRTAAEITREEYEEGRIILRQKLIQYRPKTACFVGKGVYEQFSGNKSCPWGLQVSSVVEGVNDFVAPSTSGLVRMTIDELTAVFAQIPVDGS
ncbi:MAG: mismatch-specific DNA-glycosylase [Paenibacillus sp.]|jgi:TDG/mug DNA glycosylase family protein|nr:mismatch-specific DNA-glycosylase [Paenibacillus sp.]